MLHRDIFYPVVHVGLDGVQELRVKDPVIVVKGSKCSLALGVRFKVFIGRSCVVEAAHLMRKVELGVLRGELCDDGQAKTIEAVLLTAIHALNQVNASR